MAGVEACSDNGFPVVAEGLGSSQLYFGNVDGSEQSYIRVDAFGNICYRVDELRAWSFSFRKD